MLGPSGGGFFWLTLHTY